MKHYTSEELDTKIHGFLHRKFEKYPELSAQHQIDEIPSKQSMTARMIHSLTSGTVFSLN